MQNEEETARPFRANRVQRPWGSNPKRKDQFASDLLDRETERHEERQRLKTMVYFIQAESGGLIKIGVTRNLKDRLSALQAGCPVILRVLATLPATAEGEAALHIRFRDVRRHGEWFDPVDELLALIERAQAGTIAMEGEPNLMGPYTAPGMAGRNWRRG